MGSIPTNDQYIESIRHNPSQKFLLIRQKSLGRGFAAELSGGELGAKSHGEDKENVETLVPAPDLEKIARELPPSQLEESLKSFYMRMQRYTGEYDQMKQAWENERKILYKEVEYLRKEVDYLKSQNIQALESDDEYFEKYNIQKPKKRAQPF